MSLLDDLLLGFDEALEWPVDDEADAADAAPAWEPAELAS
jgi:hypothetical protein